MTAQDNPSIAAEAPSVEAPVESTETPADSTAEQSFAEMFAEHESEQAPQSRLTPGQRVTVRVVAITADTVFVGTGAKVDGIVDREELEVDGELPYKVDDTLDLYVVNVTSQEVKLSKIIRGAGNLAALEEAREAGLPVEGKVTAQIKGGFAVDIMKRRAFCPAGQIDLRPLEDPESVIGKTLPFLITKLEKGGRNIVVSRRMILEQEQAEHRDALLEKVSVDDVIEGTVSRLAPFGAFVELAPGGEGMVHLSELSWTRVGKADEAVTVGDKVRAKILGIDRGEKGVRISLSLRRVMDDPWKSAPERLHPGDVVSGKVVRTAQFGAFVEVLPGVEGLVHISELSYERRIMKTEDAVVAGDVVQVMVKDIDLDKRRISLSMRDVAGNPWDTVEETLTLDAEVTGTFEKRAPFGLFIAVAPGLTGLMPNSALQQSKSKASLERLGPGEPVTVRIREIDAQNRRISLVPADAVDSDAAEEKDWKRHAPKPAPRPSMGTLGMALKAAMEKKK